MKANLRKIRKHRVYSEEFKREIVSLFESGKLSVCQIEKVYGISNSIIYRWIYKFSTFNERGSRVVEMKD
ncbi:MAG: transposase, partial [Flavobacteriales bacterium]|nr:transposase [Flavobacteriales bacterium]